MKVNSFTKNRLALVFVLLLTIFTILINFPKYLNKQIAWLNIALDKFKYIDQINIPSLRETAFSLGLDLQGGAQLVYKADLSRIPSTDHDDALEGVRDVIERRVNFIGVSEPVVQATQSGGEPRVIVEIAGVRDIASAIGLIGETPILEFKEQAKPETRELTEEEKKQLEEQNTKAKALSDSIIFLLAQGQTFESLASQYSEDPGSKSSGGDLGFVKRGQFVPEFDKAIFEDLKVGETTQVPVKSVFGWHIIKKEEERGQGDEKEVRARHILLVEHKPEEILAPKEPWQNTSLSGKHLKRAVVVFDPNTSAPQVSLEFNDEGEDLFADITERNVGKPVAIFLDNQPISVPTVNEKIDAGQAVISGDFNLLEAKQLAQRLNAGALPVPIELISQQQVGPTLGKESLDKSLIAGIVGIILVMIFMILYYRLPGLISALSLMIYGLILLSLFKYIPVTLTLAGIAGFILSLGMAVDVNVLNFERLKEELRDGKPLDLAIEESFRRAWPSIRDGHVSTLITCLVLIWFTTSSVKGFGVTLAIGLLVNLFTAIVITRSIMRLVSRFPIREIGWLWLYKKERN